MRHMKRLRAFSLVELLVTFIIMGILAGAFLTAMWIAWGGFFQTEDYVGARQEIEYTLQTIGGEITNISLGMPNNKSERGTFAHSFRQGPLGDSPASNVNPLMAFMGETGEAWGGPITLASIDRTAPPNGEGALHQAVMVKAPLNSANPNLYGGNAVYYAWSVPIETAAPDGSKVPARLVRPIASMNVHNNTRANVNGGREVTFNYMFSNGKSLLADFKYGDIPLGVVADKRRDPLSWLLFPTIRLPMFITAMDDSSITLQISPGTTASTSGGGDMLLAANIFPYLDPHVVRVCRIYVNSRDELVQEIFGPDFYDVKQSRVNVLAHNVLGLYFLFEKERSLLTMYLAVRGEEAAPAGDGAAFSWPGPTPLPRDSRRALLQTITWRIRN